MKIVNPRPHRNSRDNFCLYFAILCYFIWLLSVSPLRIYVREINQSLSFILNITPNFFAGCTFAFWQSYITKSKPFLSVIFAASLVTATEIIQLFIPRYTFDVWDVVAGIVGASIVVPILLWREVKKGEVRINSTNGTQL
ncbi:MAG TPA: hypothetical protein VHO50_10785 [Bacteroidales bacterium]|nr:hypothetical protein [Bacteroidales bacterium]